MNEGKIEDISARAAGGRDFVRTVAVLSTDRGDVARLVGRAEA